MIIVIAHAEEAGVRVRDFIKDNGRVPNYVSCICYNDSVNRVPEEANITMPQFLYATSTLLNQGNDAEIINVNPAASPSGDFNSGQIQEPEYRSIAENIKNFIEGNGRAPNYANSSLGTIPFDTLIDMYARIWAFMGENHITPNYVSI